MHRRSRAHGGGTAVLRADERFDGQAQVHPGLARQRFASIAPNRRCFTYLQYRACPPAFSGTALGIMGAAVEGRLDSGHDVGSVSGYLYESLPTAVQSRFVHTAAGLGASPTTI